MTKKEAVLVSAYTGFLLTKNFADVHKFCEDLLGRPIWTHEFASEDVQKEIKEKCFPLIIKLIKSEVDDIANGVTVQEWISVKDGLPKLIPCDAGTAYSEAVNVLTTGRKVLTAIWDGFNWICDAEFWDAEDEEITHWTPVLLPLPQPPKGEQP